MEIGHTIEIAVGSAVDKEKFNKELILVAEREGAEVTYSDDKYVMVIHVGVPKIAIPIRYITEQANISIIEDTIAPMDKLLEELQHITMIEEYDECMYQEEKLKQSQMWKKSNQRHPAFKKR